MKTGACLSALQLSGLYLSKQDDVLLGLDEHMEEREHLLHLIAVSAAKVIAGARPEASSLESMSLHTINIRIQARNWYQLLLSFFNCQLTFKEWKNFKRHGNEKHEKTD